MKCVISRMNLWILSIATALTLVACGGSGNSNSSNPQNGTLSISVSDDSSADWATIGVRVLSISLVPQAGGSPVAVYTAPSPAPIVNLMQLDQLSEILGNVQVPSGTYTGANITLGGNSGDVTLTVAADPEAGFAGTPGATFSAANIQIQGTTGSAGNLTVPLKVNFVQPLVVTSGTTNALDLEFDLAHPAFIVAHAPLGGGSTLWAVSFNGIVRHHPLPDLVHLLLRDIYGTVSSVSSDNTSIAVTRDFPTEPPVTPESAVTTSDKLTIKADTANGTIFYDLDAKNHFVIHDFSSLSGSLPNKFVRVAARYQTDGSLIAVRIWASSSFNAVWLNPEGHILHVDTTGNTITVEKEDGAGVQVAVNANTQFFFRAPDKAVADATAIGTGTGFLTNLKRGFKVHIGVVDPLASPLVASTVDIEAAEFSGAISLTNSANFTYTRTFNTASDNYTMLLPYISSSTANGKDANGNPISGFKWWNFTFPTLADTGSNAITDFVNATNGSVSFGGSVPALKVWGVSNAIWGDPANASGWSTNWTILLPTSVPLGSVSTGFAANSGGGLFSMTVPGGANPVTVDLSSVSGSATLVYQVDRTSNIVTVTPVDITSTSGLATVTNNLTVNTPVKVFGIPQSSGHIKAYVVFYYTGATKPSV